jgi:hypothetical protein
MTRGRRGWLGLQRAELASAAICRSSRRTKNVGFRFVSLLREMTKNAEHAMHTVALSCTRARKQTLAASPGCLGTKIGLISWSAPIALLMISLKCVRCLQRYRRHFEI